VEEGGELAHLQENYRSAPPIAQFSNELCKVMMDGRGKPASTADSAVDLSYRVRVSDMDLLKPKSHAPFLGITYVAAESGAKAVRGREMEAEAIARLLKQWKSEGRIQNWKEAALLMRTMTNVEIYLSALESHGIPVYVVQGTAFYQKSEVSDLIAFLELVLHPQDSLLRAIVLTSSLFGVGFADLLEKSDLGQDFGLGPVLDPWVRTRDSATAAEILQDVIRRTNF